MWIGTQRAMILSDASYTRSVCSFSARSMRAWSKCLLARMRNSRLPACPNTSELLHLVGLQIGHDHLDLLEPYLRMSTSF